MPYGGNLRKEVVKTRKWYFYDNGIRNAIINDFKHLSGRTDMGMLWEQFILSERQKRNHYKQYFPEYFFWRTYDQQEIDLIEINPSGIQAIECKWGNEKTKLPVAFAKTYPDAKFDVLNKENFLEWIG